MGAMLIRRPVLERIKAGEITLVFRRWRRATVKAGGTLKTSVGLLAFDRVDVVEPAEIDEEDARQAGYPSRSALLADLAAREEGEIYRIGVAYAGEDPRLALRENDRLSDADVAEIVGRLRRLDRASKLGPWTHRTLEAIEARPHVAAVSLATSLGYERAWFKPNVRKLKAMGLTISHRPGYEISPRGAAVLRVLREGAQ
jgi:hypothetical protein